MAPPISDEEMPHTMPTLHEDGVEVRPAKPRKLPKENRPSMPGVSFYPGDDDALCFQRPLNRSISRLLVITNRNPYSVAYKIKTTNPKIYLSRPISGKVEPGQNINVTIEQVPLQEEPPLDAKCKDRFSIQLATVTPEREELSIDDVFKSARENDEPDYHHNIRVTYLPAEGLSPEELVKYSAGVAQLIPGEKFSVYPTTALCFRRPLWRPENLRGYIAMTNIYTLPLAFRIMFTPAENIKMYSVKPSSGKLESGQRLEIKVVRQPVEKDPTLEDECIDVFGFLCTIIDPKENLELIDIWKRAEEQGAIFQKELRVRFIPWRGLTPEEELMQAQQGVFDRLMKEDDEEYEKEVAKKLGQGQENNEAGEELLTKAQEASIRKWLLPIAPRVVPKQPEKTDADKFSRY
ncbi:hypothetical protein HYPSUDRAFT_49730 [Hypholoma sublateritium FD-334 SS-4]|uniref:MSP domain-containing protein n=1 Tax=Hypholoma sublateritium (strain FD-334 SS-4) TaxID=945553 RepID=A0A0D2NAL8_HYPSF|nr:hypothetical protein HYPSUDRAFT_49730 [Hypholoma sublateritium FD-334 SS-4]